MRRLPWVMENVPLAPFTTYRIGGNARWLARPATEEEAGRTLAAAAGSGERVLVLGGGSNLLVADAGVDAVVIHLDGAGEFGRIERDPADDTLWRVGAAVPLQTVAATTARAGCAGLECLAGIPGTVGGAAAMNAGGAEGDIGEAVVEADVLEADGRRRRLNPVELAFGYRRSALQGRLAVGLTLRLSGRCQPDAILARMRDWRRRKESTQPLGLASAGCVFRNPPDAAAGRLLDDAGCKGLRHGGAEVSRVHANFIVNTGGATAGDVLGLAAAMRHRVRERFGVRLELEVAVWGATPGTE